MTGHNENRMLAKWAVKVASAVLLTLGTLGIAFYSVAGNQSVEYGESPVVSELAHLELTDQHGKRLTGKDLKDKLVMMNFFFTGCTGACPVQTAVLRNVQQGLDPELDVLFVSVSIAPLTDTKATIDEYIEKFDVDAANWKFATASVQNSEKLIERFGVTVDGAVVEEGKLDQDERLVREITELNTLTFETS